MASRSAQEKAAQAQKRAGSNTPPLLPAFPRACLGQLARESRSDRGLLAWLLSRLLRHVESRNWRQHLRQGDHGHEIALPATGLRRLEGAASVHLAVGQAGDL